MSNKVLNEEELSVLAYITSLKSFARAEYIELEGLGKYNTDNTIIQTLLKEKYLSVNKSGSIMHDRTKVRDTLKTYSHPTKYKLSGINSHWLFKSKTEV
jgi:hypothetical protein